jgi:nucleotide-binding universal stress UspA family protein
VEHVERHGHDAERYLHTLAADRLDGRDWRFVLSQDPPADAVLQTARSEQADLIVLATHNRHGVDRLMHGSVAHTVLKHAEAPMLLLEGKETEPAP